jgi:hypothetical protein
MKTKIRCLIKYHLILIGMYFQALELILFEGRDICLLQQYHKPAQSTKAKERKAVEKYLKKIMKNQAGKDV